MGPAPSSKQGPFTLEILKKEGLLDFASCLATPDKNHAALAYLQSLSKHEAAAIPSGGGTCGNEVAEGDPDVESEGWKVPVTTRSDLGTIPSASTSEESGKLQPLRCPDLVQYQPDHRKG